MGGTRATRKCCGEMQYYRGMKLGWTTVPYCWRIQGYEISVHRNLAKDGRTTDSYTAHLTAQNEGASGQPVGPPPSQSLQIARGRQPIDWTQAVTHNVLQE